MSEQAMPEQRGDQEGVEILRAWVQDDTLHCSLLAGAFSDAAAWGTVLADLARHAAEAMQEDEGTDPTEALLQIREAFVEELENGPASSEDTPEDDGPDMTPPA